MLTTSVRRIKIRARQACPFAWHAAGYWYISTWLLRWQRLLHHVNNIYQAGTAIAVFASIEPRSTLYLLRSGSYTGRTLGHCIRCPRLGSLYACFLVLVSKQSQRQLLGLCFAEPNVVSCHVRVSCCVQHGIRYRNSLHPHYIVLPNGLAEEYETRTPGGFISRYSVSSIMRHFISFSL